MRDSPLFRAMQLREQSMRLQQHGAAVLARAEEAVLAARLTRGFYRAAQQTPAQWDAHAERWDALVGEETQQLLDAERQALLGGVPAPGTAEESRRLRR
jgi:hypothetical protein